MMTRNFHFALYRPHQCRELGYEWYNSVSTRAMAKSSIDHMVNGLWGLFHRRNEVKVIRIPCSMDDDARSEYYRLAELRKLNDRPHTLARRVKWPSLVEDISDERLQQLKEEAGISA